VKVQGVLVLLGGKLTLGSNTEILVLPGGVISGSSNSEKIRIGNTEVFSGDEQPVTGPALANRTTGGGFTNFNLPVQFISFTVTRASPAVLLEWATATESGADRYEIERSEDGTKWSKIGVVAAAGTTSSISTYRFSDGTPAATGVVYYRIKQVDLNGRSAYTGIKSIRQAKGEAAIGIGSNNGAVVLHFPNQVNGSVVISYVSMAGQKLGEQRINDAVGQVVLQPANVKGAVIVSISNAKGLQAAKQVKL
jgi:hypothetical protein